MLSVSLFSILNYKVAGKLFEINDLMFSFFITQCSMQLKAVAVLYVEINYAELISYPADSLSREYISAEMP